MTWNPNNPLASDKIRNWPSAVTSNNWPRIQDIVNADHNFSTTAGATQGYHKVVHYINQAGAFGDNTPANISAVGQLYTKTQSYTGIASRQELFFRPGTSPAAANECPISVFPVRAAGVVNSGGTLQDGAFNIDSVGVAGSVLTVNFTIAMPSAFYIPLAIAQGTQDAWIEIDPATAPTTTTVKFKAKDRNGDASFNLIFFAIFGG